MLHYLNYPENKILLTYLNKLTLLVLKVPKRSHITNITIEINITCTFLGKLLIIATIKKRHNVGIAIQIQT